METKGKHPKKFLACLLTVVMTFCTFTMPVKADFDAYLHVDWNAVLGSLRSCRYNFYNYTGADHKLSDTSYDQLITMLDHGWDADAIEFLSDIYMQGKHNDSDWMTIKCTRIRIGGKFSEAMDQYISSVTGSVIDDGTKNWWLLTETIMIVGVAGTGIIVYKKKKRKPQKS